MSWQALISSSLQGEINTLTCAGLMLGLLRIAGIMKCSTVSFSQQALDKFEFIDFVSNSYVFYVTNSSVKITSTARSVSVRKEKLMRKTLTKSAMPLVSGAGRRRAGTDGALTQLNCYPC